jgi:hypothetical protein
MSGRLLTGASSTEEEPPSVASARAISPRTAPLLRSCPDSVSNNSGRGERRGGPRGLVGGRPTSLARSCHPPRLDNRCIVAPVRATGVLTA